MKNKKVGKSLILGVLFFLPVAFLIFLYPATHNYTPLDIVHRGILDLKGFSSDSKDSVRLDNHITVLSFLGTNPIAHAMAATNLKTLVYDRFKGFKKFQMVIVVPRGTEASIEKLKAEVASYENVRFWHVVFGTPKNILRVFNSLKSAKALDSTLATNCVFIIDEDMSQRGRSDDRTAREKTDNLPVYGLNAYNSINVSEIEHKMSDDLRILFTEYRQKRKGTFDASTRRDKSL